MTEGFTAKPLSFNKIDQAYAVVRTVRPDFSMEDWRALAGPCAARGPDDAAPRRGVVVVENAGGYIVGLFCYAACDHLHHEKALRIDPLIALDLFNVDEIMELLLREADSLARRFGLCVASGGAESGRTAVVAADSERVRALH